jgi:hypothetical protein
MIAQDMLHLGQHFDGRQRYVEDLTLGRDLSLHAPAREKSMSFQVVRHEHPNIFCGEHTNIRDLPVHRR